MLPPSEPAAEAAAAFIVIPLILVALLAAVVALIRLILLPRRDVVERERTRYDFFNAGNPPTRPEARRKLSMQYLGYLILFLAVEPAAVLMALLTVAPQSVYDRVIIAFGILVAAYTPLLAYALREARRAEAWMLEA
ncbi:MAG: NADH-quinone oxidoreductase subunit A [Desulfurococcales archaeon]|nr:NADH-quinone oxidoreductase subunit A [Desulfurococcales archaeon]